MDNKKIKTIAFLALVAAFVLGSWSCSKNDDDTTTTPNNNTGGTVDLSIYQKIYGATEVYQDGDFVVIKTNTRPDHKSPYYVDTQWESNLYEAYNGSNSQFMLNPNRIGEQTMTFRIPLNPQEATNKQATPMGAIGISLNGVVFFNQYAAGFSPLANEINSFDQYNGHPANTLYHYHIEPTYLTSTKGKDVLLGFLLDGFPVYGPQENGQTVTNADLDAYHGHTHATTDYPNGIYHYHITDSDPYINGDGFYGTAGTVTR